MIDKIMSGRYLIRERVGAGGMAVVYRATDIRTGDNVALKVLRPEYNNDEEYTRRFVQEADAASKMFHENIVNTLGYGEDEGNRYIVMEYVKGHTLKYLIQKKGHIPAHQAVTMVIRILAGVDHAHKNQIIHRDIKPQNILVDRHNQVKVADFGIARSLRKSEPGAKDASLAIGSVHYLSPEQAAGEAADAQSDLYSVGVVLYEMLTGRLPFEDDDPQAVAEMHVRETPLSMREIDPSISKGLDEVVMRALSKDRFRRYHSAAEMAQDLKLALRHKKGGFVRYPQTEAEKQEQHQKRLQQYKKLLQWALVGIVCIMVLALAALGINAHLRRQRYKNMVHMPALVGEMMQAADGMLAEKELRYSVEYAFDDTAPEGMVIGQSIKSGEWLEKDSTVALTVCAGKNSVEMPLVMGRPTADAVAMLTENGVEESNIVIIPQVAEGMDIGRVLGVLPDSHKVGRNETVTLTVGAKACSVPYVIGNSVDAARLALVAAGLKAGQIDEAYSPDGIAGTVMAQSLTAESIAAAGTAVDLTIVQSNESAYYMNLNTEVTVPEGGAKVLLAVQAPSGNTFEVEMQLEEGGVHQLSLASEERGTHIIDIYINGVWEKQISGEFN